jgi:hypothetical protein
MKVRMRNTLWVPTCLLWFLVSPLLAVASGNATSIRRLELYPNFQTISVYAFYEGDANSNNDTRLEYRREGGDWREGHHPTRLAGGVWTGSMFWLDPATRYEVRVTFTDPDGVDGGGLLGSITTRNDHWPVGLGKPLYVSPGGRGDGSSPSSPLGSIQKAVDLADPGDTVLLAPGVYRQSVVVRNSGTPEAYILIKGQPGAILDGSDEGFLDRSGPPRWSVAEHLHPKTPGQDRVREDFVADCDWPVDLVAIDDQKLYGYQTLEEMLLCPAGPPGGWFQDRRSGKLYVHVTRAWISPNRQKVVVSHLAKGLTLDGCHHVVIDGLEVRYYGKVGIDIRGSDNVVQNCLVHHQDLGINMYGKSFHNNTIQNCEVYQTSIYRWPWKLTKNTRYEVDDISARGGRGTVVRKNIVHGSFDGIGLSVWKALEEPGWMQDTDVHDNDIYECADDGAEPEGTCTNLRFWNNRIRRCLMTMSIAPVTVGPVYYINETYWDFHLNALKIQARTRGVVYLYNCTFYANGYRQSTWDSNGEWWNLHFRNCIFRGTDYVFNDSGPSKQGTASFDYDDLSTTRSDRLVRWEGRTFNTLEEFQKEGYELHGLSVDPGFVNPSDGDFRLRPDSPLIDKGLHIPGINDAFSGSAPDMGSHEYTH